jgi:hypothetical protein
VLLGKILRLGQKVDKITTPLIGPTKYCANVHKDDENKVRQRTCIWEK